MGNVLTFVMAQMATIAVSVGLTMAYLNLLLWGVPLLFGIIFSVAAIVNNAIVMDNERKTRS